MFWNSEVVREVIHESELHHPEVDSEVEKAVETAKETEPQMKICPTCGELIPATAKLIIEGNKEFCDYCISDPRYNPIANEVYGDMNMVTGLVG